MTNYEESTCRICWESKDSLFSLVNNKKGVSLFNKLMNKTKIQIDMDTGPTSICSQCLIELEATITFLEKCEMSNVVLSAKCTDINLSDEDYKSSAVVYEEDVKSLDSGSKETPGTAEPAKCPECGSLRRCEHWAPQTTHTCQFCQKVFTRRFNFKLHLKRHLGEKDWPCPQCGVKQLTQWLARRHCGPRARRSCPVAGCDKSFTTNTNLKSHIRTHYGEKPFACTVCEKTFTTKNTLNDHLRIHTGVKPYMCPICGRQFATNKLAAHIRSHGGGSGRTFACASAACTRTFATRRALVIHARTHSAAAERYACPHCPAAYAHVQSLRKHTRQRHPLPPDAATDGSVI